jgi:hypothetical protein
MTPADVVRWIVALGCLTIAVLALATTNLGKRNALSMGFSISIGAVFCLTHLINGEPALARAIDAIMLAAVCLGVGALFGHAYRLHRAERPSGLSASRARLKS